MQQSALGCNALLSGLVLFLSLVAFVINHFIFHYPGNNYFPDKVMFYALILILFYLGLRLCFPKENKLCMIGKELLYFFTVMVLIALATNATQLTPFPPIDQYIINFEAKIHIHLSPLVFWTNEHPQIKNLLNIIYDSLPYQMSFLPLIVILTCRIHLLREYYFFMLSTVLLGFSFYYFFPTTAPASILDLTLFSQEQIATGLKFNQIHHNIPPTTNAGGLIALPSFHVIWAILCVNLLREWLIPTILLALVNGVLIVSCVLLGWHYITDVFGSALVLLLCYFLYHRCAAFFKKSG